MAIKAALKKWSQTVAASPEWYKAPEEERQAVRADFFRTVVEPTLKEGELDAALQEFDLATRPLKDEVFKDPIFASLDDDKKREIIGANLYAHGAIKKYGDDYKGITGRLASVNPTSDKSQVEGALRTYKAPAAMEGALAPIKGAGQLAAAGVAGIANLVAPDSEYAKGANTNLANINQDINEAAALKKRDPSGALTNELASNLTIGLLTGGPAQQGIKQVLGQGTTKLGQFGRWLVGATAVGGGGSAVTSAEQIDPNNPDQVGATLSEKGRTAATGVAFQAGSDALLNPATRKFARGAYDEVMGSVSSTSRMRDVADDLTGTVRESLDAGVGPTRTGAVVGSEQDVLDNLTQARQNVANAPGGIMFTGAESGSLPIATSQAGVANTSFSDVSLRKFEKPVAGAASRVSAVGQEVELPKTAAHVRTKYKPQVVKEFTVARNEAVKAAKQEVKDASNAMFAQARESGVLAEPIGITKNQLKARIEDVLKDPNMQKRGVERLKPVQLLLSETDGPAQLTVGDITAYNQMLSEAIESGVGDDVKVIMDVVSEPLSASQSEGVAKVWQLYRQGQDNLDVNLAGIRAEFNEAAAIERTFANAPLKKQLAQGASAQAVSAAALGELPKGELAEVLGDAVTAKTTRAAVAADIADTLNAKEVVNGVEQINVAAVYDKFKNNQEAIKEIFKGNKEFLTDFDAIMRSGKAASTYATARGVVPGEAGSAGVKGIVGGLGGKVSGAGTAASANIYQRIAERLNKRTRAILRDSAFDQGKFDELLGVSERLQKKDINYSAAYDNFHGLRAVGSATARTAAGQDTRDRSLTPAATPLKGDTKSRSTGLKMAPEASLNTTITPLAAKFEEAKIPPARMQYAAQVIGQESNFGKAALPRGGPKAQGLGQFFGAAKKEVEARIGRKLDMFDETDSLLATAAYAEINEKRLKAKGINPTEPDLYAAHFLGAGGFSKLKQRIGDKVAAAGLVDRATFKNNRTYFFDKEGKYRTPAQVIQAIHNNYNKHKDAAKMYLANK